MKVCIWLLALLIVPSLIFIVTPKALASSAGYEKASKYMIASNRKKHPAQKQKRATASTKKSKKKNQKRKVASTKSKKKKGKKKKPKTT